jgi:hypothetical protein
VAKDYFVKIFIKKLLKMKNNPTFATLFDERHGLLDW